MRDVGIINNELSHKFLMFMGCIIDHHFGVISIQCQDNVVKFGNDGKDSRTASTINLGSNSPCELRGAGRDPERV